MLSLAAFMVFLHRLFPAGVWIPKYLWTHQQSGALLLAVGSVAVFHLPYVFPPLSFLIVVYLYCLFQLAALPTPRKAFYFGLVIGYAVYAPHLTFFLNWLA